LVLRAARFSESVLLFLLDLDDRSAGSAFDAVASWRHSFIHSASALELRVRQAGAFLRREARALFARIDLFVFFGRRRARELHRFVARFFDSLRSHFSSVKAFLSVSFVTVHAGAGVRARRVFALGCGVTVVNVESALVDVGADVVAVAFEAVETLALGFVRPPAGNDFAFGVLVAFLVAANVVHAHVLRVIFVSVGADALVAARRVAAHRFRRVGAEKRVFEALVHVFALFGTVAAESIFAGTLDRRLVFWHAIGVFNARAVA